MFSDDLHDMWQTARPIPGKHAVMKNMQYWMLAYSNDGQWMAFR